MAEPVQGIHAVPDEGNSRYFHVVVAGPKDVSQKPHKKRSVCCMCAYRVPMREGHMDWSYFCQRSTQWPHPK